MKEFLVSFFIFLIVVSSFAFLYEKEPETIEIPVAVESTTLKEENEALKNQLSEKPTVKYKYVYVESEDEEDEEPVDRFYVPSQQQTEAHLPGQPRYIANDFEPNRITYLTGNDRFVKAPPCGCE